MNDHLDVTHRRIDAFAPPEIAGEERDLRQRVALVAGEHAHVAIGVDEPSHDMSSQAAGAAGDEDW